MVKRISDVRLLISGLCAVLFALCFPAEAQQPQENPRIGFLGAPSPSTIPVRLEAFRQGLRELGYVEGKNIVIYYRYAEGKLDRVPALAAELVRLKVDVIVTGGSAATRPAKEATITIPIVMAQDTDPVGNKFVASLARPGGNVTGLSSLTIELSTKRLEVLKDAVPKLARVGFLTVPETSITSNLQLKALRPAAVALKLKLEEIKTQLDPKGLESAFQTAKQKQVNAIMTSSARPFFAARLFTWTRS